MKKTILVKEVSAVAITTSNGKVETQALPVMQFENGTSNKVVVSTFEGFMYSEGIEGKVLIVDEKKKQFIAEFKLEDLLKIASVELVESEAE